LWIKLWMILPVLLLFYGTGLVLYAFYKIHGDPLAAGHITKPDQILPYFVVSQLPAGLPGLLIAAIFAASMSTSSAGVNSLTSATLCDFYQTLAKPEKLTERRLLNLARWYTLFYGALVTLLAFLIHRMPGNLVESVNTIIALVGGPMLGLFLLGIFSKKATTFGALMGCLVGFVLPLAVYIYSLYYSPLISFLWYTMFGTLLTMGVGVITSGRSEPPSDPHRSP
jgi:sodium-coupled monocarboxylate transporter 8/12